MTPIRLFLLLSSALAAFFLTASAFAAPPVPESLTVDEQHFPDTPIGIAFRATDADGDLKHCIFWHWNYSTSGWTPIDSHSTGGYFYPLQGSDSTAAITWLPVPDSYSGGPIRIHVGVYDHAGNSHENAPNGSGGSGVWIIEESQEVAPIAATETVGTLGGDVSVDNKGAANYSIPLDIPVGRAGMQPSLSVNYSSQGGNGLMGVGFALSAGQSSITRGRSILARDSEVRGVQFDDSDKLYLDGKRLILVSGTYLKAGSAYRTEVESFSKITAHHNAGSSNADADYFKVETKEGRVMYYGGFGEASDAYQSLGGETEGKAYVYGLTRVEDLQGNYMRYSYRPVGNGEHVLDSVDYTGHSSSDLPFAKIKLLYNQNLVTGDADGAKLRDDVRTGYMAGRQTRVAYRLDNVVASVDFGSGLEEVRRYDFLYEYAPVSELTRLNEIEFYARADAGAWSRTPSTTFDWSDDHYSTVETDTTIDSSANMNTTGFGALYERPLLTGDFNGDGFTDYADPTNSGGVKVRLANGSGGFESVQTWLSPAATHSLFYTGDFNADGMTDLFWADIDLSVFKMALSTGSATDGFRSLTGSTTPTTALNDSNLFKDQNGLKGWTLSGDVPPYSGRVTIADFNGDGRDDILYHTFKGELKVQLMGDYSIGSLSNWKTGLQKHLTTEWYVGEGFLTKFREHRDRHTIRPFISDYNGDGLLDYLWVEFVTDNGCHTTPYFQGFYANCDANTNYKIKVVLTKPNGSFSDDLHLDGGFHSWSASGHMVGGVISNPAYTLKWQDSFAKVIPGDFNGDGIGDILTLGFGRRDAGNTGLPGWTLYQFKGTAATGKASVEKILDPIPAKFSNGGRDLDTFWFPVTEEEWDAELGNFHWTLMDPTLHDSPRYFATAISPAVSNTIARDLNGDGRTDYAWVVGARSREHALSSPDPITSTLRGVWVCWAEDGGFSSPERLSYTGFEGLHDFLGDGSVPAATSVFLAEYQIQQVNLESSGPDWVLIEKGSVPKYHFAHVDAGPSDKLVGVTNGLGREIEVEYKPISDDSVYVKGALDDPFTLGTVEGTSYPIREERDSRHVVATVHKDYGGDFDGGDKHTFNYVYSGARTDLSGRGFLGYHSFVTHDVKNELFSYQFLTQSFPMTGLSKREQTFRQTDAASNPTRLRLLDWTEHSVTCDEVGDGSSGYGTMMPMTTQSVGRKWEDSPLYNVTVDPGDGEAVYAFGDTLSDSPHTTITTEVWFDSQPQGSAYTTLPSGFAVQDDKPVGLNATQTATMIAAFPNHITHGNVVKTVVDYGEGLKDTTTSNYYADSHFPDAYLPGKLKDTTTVSASPHGNVTSPTQSFTYFASGSKTGLVLTDKTDAPGSSLDSTTTYDYNAYGLPTTTAVSGSSFADRTVSNFVAYDDTYRFPTQVDNAYGHSQYAEHSPVHGQVVKSWDLNRPEAKAVVTSYDALGRPTSSTDPLLDQTLVTTMAYSTASGSIASPGKAQTRGAASSSGIAYSMTQSATRQPPVTTYYNRLAQPIRVSKTGYGGQVTHVDTHYDEQGRVVAVSNPYASGSTPQHWSYTRHDALGRIDQLETPAFGSSGNRETTTTGAKVNLTTTKFHGRFAQVTVDAHDRSPQATTTLANAKGQTIAVWNADNGAPALTASNYGETSTAGASLVYTLDGAGRMVRTDMKGTSAFITAAYDQLGNQTQLDDPDKGVWNYQYDALGQLVWQENARDDVTTMGYDLLGRQIWRKVQESGTSSSYEEETQWHYWDIVTAAADNRVAAPADGWVGGLQRVENASDYASTGSKQTYQHAVSYDYNDKGQLTLDLHHVDGKYYYFYTKYDGYGLVDRRDYFWRPSGLELDYTSQPELWSTYGLQYQYDTSYSYVERIVDSQNKEWWEAEGSGAYDHLDRPVSYRKGEALVTARAYDPASQLLTGIDTGSLQNLSYAWDGLGNLASRSSGGLSETFGYDSLNRLEKRNGSTIASYSDTGNILSKTDVSGNASGTYLYGHSTKVHAATSAWGYALGYDANGNVSSRSGNGTSWDFRWTAFDKPRHMDNGTKGSEFVYDGNRQRTAHLKYDRAGSAKHFRSKKIYVGSQMEIDFANQASGTSEDWAMETLRIYVDGPDGRSGAYEFRPEAPEGEAHKRYVYHQDHLGSVQSITEHGQTGFAKDGAGKDSVYSYDPWGERRDPTDWSGKPATTAQGGESDLTPRGYTDHEMLDDMGLVHMNGRIYDPLLGRFLSADKLVDGHTNLQGFNRYSYLKNNPLNATDPTGYESAEEWLKSMESMLENIDSVTDEEIEVMDAVVGAFASNSEVNDVTVGINDSDLSVKITTNLSKPSPNEAGLKENDVAPKQIDDVSPEPPSASSDSGTLSAIGDANNGRSGVAAAATNTLVDEAGLGASAKGVAKALGKGTTATDLVIGAVEVAEGFEKDDHSFGYNTQKAVAETAGGMAGAWVGAEGGAALGALIGSPFGGVGAVPGAVIGGVVGGIVGAITGGKIGSKVGGAIVDEIHDK